MEYKRRIFPPFPLHLFEKWLLYYQLMESESGSGVRSDERQSCFHPGPDGKVDPAEVGVARGCRDGRD